MAINVVCPGCHSRFAVSEKFAGKKGPCPKCKRILEIPKPDQQIKVHEREYGGSKSASGQLVLKPLERGKFRFRPVAVAGVLAPVVILMGLAWWMGTSMPKDKIDTLILALGAMALAPPLVFGGYSFLRDDEKEPYRGLELTTRVAICSAAYALLWGGFALVPAEMRRVGGVELPPSQTLEVDPNLATAPPPKQAEDTAKKRPRGDDPLRPPTLPGEEAAGTDAGFEAEPESSSDFLTLALVIVPFLAAGTGIAYGVLDLEISSSIFHYLLYLIACIACRLLIGLPPI